MTRRCAWCGRVYTDEGWRPERRQEEPPQITHAICPSCHAAWRSGEGEGDDSGSIDG